MPPPPLSNFSCAPLLLKFTACYLIIIETHTHPQKHTRIYKYNLLRSLRLLICIYVGLWLRFCHLWGASSLEKTDSPSSVVVTGLALLIFR